MSSDLTQALMALGLTVAGLSAMDYRLLRELPVAQPGRTVTMHGGQGSSSARLRGCSDRALPERSRGALSCAASAVRSDQPPAGGTEAALRRSPSGALAAAAPRRPRP